MYYGYTTEMQSVYSAALAEWTISYLFTHSKKINYFNFKQFSLATVHSFFVYTVK